MAANALHMSFAVPGTFDFIAACWKSTVHHCEEREMSAKTLAELFLWQLKDVYGAEHQILKALPKMAKKASTPALRDAFETHLKETEKQVQRLDKVFEAMGVKASAEKCKALEGIVEEAED